MTVDDKSIAYESHLCIMKSNLSDILQACLAHQDFLPCSAADAEARLAELPAAAGISGLDDDAFRRAWLSLFWLYPGLHPDGCDEWEGEFSAFRPLAEEAFKRFEAGRITEEELYPDAAAHDRLMRALRSCTVGGP